MIGSDDIEQQRTLVAAHQRTLAHLLTQQAQFSAGHIPAHVANGIADARAAIQRIKADLRSNGVAVDDMTGDEIPPTLATIEAAPALLHSGDMVAGDNVLGDKVQGDKITIENAHLHTALSLTPPSIHQLRARASDFVGRTREIDDLVQALSTSVGVGLAAIGGVRGMGGIGKTELAYVVANRLHEDFPDAQIVLGLRGSSEAPLTPAQALRHVIASLAPEAKLSDDLSALEGAYRSLLHGKKILLLADDARNAAQVRPLIPPSGCALLVTSRRRFELAGMAILDLHVLPPPEGIKLLLSLAPAVGAHAAAIAQLCGYLPLALRVVGGLLKRTTRPISEYVVLLEDERNRLARMRDPRANLDVEATLSLSYDALDQATQHLLCQLAVFPASFDRFAAEQIILLPDGSDLIDLLDLLYTTNLLEYDPISARYALHELIRVFARARLENADAVRLRHAQHYADVAWQTDELYKQGGVSVLTGLALFDRERINIDTGWNWVQQQPTSPDHDVVLCSYAGATVSLGDLRYDPRSEQIPRFTAALVVARRRNNLIIASAMLGNLGHVHMALGESQLAKSIFEQVLVIAREQNDREQECTALGSLGTACYQLGEIRPAIDWLEQQLQIAQEISDTRGVIAALGILGLCYRTLGEPRNAMTYEEQALTIARAIGDRRREGGLLSNIGTSSLALGETQRAAIYYEEALVIAREIGDRQQEAGALGGLGSVYRVSGNVQLAIQYHEQRLAIAREIGDRHAEGEALGNLGIAYFAMGDAQQAIAFCQQQVIIAQEIGELQALGAGCWNLGNMLIQQGQLAEAAKVLQTTVDYQQSVEHPNLLQSATLLDQVQWQRDGK